MIVAGIFLFPFFVYAATTLIITVADSTGSVGLYPSITLGADDFAVISYYDLSNRDLKVLKCGNAACSSGNTITTVDTTGDVGSYPSITLGADDLPIISYYYATDNDLKVLKCGNAACSSGNTITSVDTADQVGSYSSITIGADDNPVISYYDLTNDDLKVLKCGNAACSSGNTITTVDTTGDVGIYSSITLGADDNPVISYHDLTNRDLKVLKCGNAACSSGNTITTVDTTGSVGGHTSITLGADDNPVISYNDATNGDLKVLKCGNAACSSGNTATSVDTTGDVGYFTSIALGSDDNPVISYRDFTNLDLKVAKCGNAACSSGNTATTLDTTGDVGVYTSITIGSDDLPIISHFDDTNDDLKVVKCGNAACSSAPSFTLTSPSSGATLTVSTPTISGTGTVVGTSVSAYSGATVLCSTTVNNDVNKTWSCSSSALDNGEYTIHAADANGFDSESITITIAVAADVPDDSSDSTATTATVSSGGRRGSTGNQTIRDTLVQRFQSIHAAAKKVSVLTGFQQRVCNRVWRRFFGISLERVNERLQKRLGFVCS